MSFHNCDFLIGIGIDDDGTPVTQSVIRRSLGRVSSWPGGAVVALERLKASSDLAPSARERFIQKEKDDLPALLSGPLNSFVKSRAEELAEDHARLRAAAGSASRVSVEAVMPPDVIGLFVLLPSEV